MKAEFFKEMTREQFKSEFENLFDFEIAMILRSNLKLIYERKSKDGVEVLIKRDDFENVVRITTEEIDKETENDYKHVLEYKYRLSGKSVLVDIDEYYIDRYGVHYC